MNDRPTPGRRRRRRRGGNGYPGGPSPAGSIRGSLPAQRVWQCPSCGRTRPGATADARAPLCRNDLAEMRIALIPSTFQPRFYRPRPKAQGPTSRF